MKILLSLYGCEPNRGSEPGIGWAWALGMSKRHRIYCLTRANNQQVIEEELIKLEYLKQPTNEKGVSEYKSNEGTTLRFIFVDLPNWIMKLKKRNIIPTSLYYLLWQFEARRYFDSLKIKVDIIHHVTFCSFVIPGVWWNRKEKVIVGPLGGTNVTATQFLPLFPFIKRTKEFLRSMRVKLWFLNPITKKSIKNADYLFIIQKEFALSLNKYKKPYSLIEDVAVPAKLLNCTPNPTKIKENKFIWAGVHEPIKGMPIAIKAYHKAFSNNLDSAPILKIYGSGSVTKKMKSLCKELKLENNVLFLGKAMQEPLWEEISQSLGFIFTSVRDTFGCIALEAMACEATVVCFNHHGIGQLTTDETAIKIKPQSINQAIDDFAIAFSKLANEPELNTTIGYNARKFVLENLTWEAKFNAVDKVYESLLQNK